MTKNCQKWPQNKIFGLLKNQVLILSGIGVKRKLLWSLKILQKLQPWEKSGSQVMTKHGSQSDFDFWNVLDMNERKNIY